MQSGDSRMPASSTGELAEAEYRALCERIEQARAAASQAIAQYATLLAHARHEIAQRDQALVAIDATREMIRQSVHRYATLMRALEISPERTLRLVKETVIEQLPHPQHEIETNALMRNVVTWCIEAYYGKSPAA